MNNAKKEEKEEDDDGERSGADGTDGDEGDDGEAFTVDKAMSFFKVAFPSFLAGGVVTLGFLFLPLLSDYYEAYNYHNVGSGGAGSPSPSSSSATGRAINDNGNNGNNGNNNNVVVQQNVNQPVILFETILNDLNDAYVDDVDVQKLFETGVKAMTSSLDPYTEFESRVDARELEESVTGRYGGVGLVIRGGTNLKLASFEEEEGEEATTTGGGSAGVADAVPMEGGAGAEGVDSPRSLLPGGGASPVAAREAGGVSGKTPAGGKAQKVDVDDGVDGDEMERRRARKKSMEDGIHVVSAFEGERAWWCRRNRCLENVAIFSANGEWNTLFSLLHTIDPPCMFLARFCLPFRIRLRCGNARGGQAPEDRRLRHQADDGCRRGAESPARRARHPGFHYLREGERGRWRRGREEVERTADHNLAEKRRAYPRRQVFW